MSVLFYQATIITEAAVTPWKGGGYGLQSRGFTASVTHHLCWQFQLSEIKNAMENHTAFAPEGIP